ncbi:hypothetical protein LTR84_006774 [Exophiala bonariae]|uniref:ADP-ribosylhydrolase ARH3 n=1 Tax=Exophiala bonariae TaxID=1690606 RepID=A0AAV9N220_9EURO|nr:hypothetical protein LTR84_006774 [Exophiala bonariae]
MAVVAPVLALQDNATAGSQAPFFLRADELPQQGNSNMSTSPPLASRIQGAIYGLATCDALGGPVEFRKRGSFPKVISMQPNDNFGLVAGCFTDDTSMALCLAHSLVENNGKTDTADQVQKYIAWWQRGYQSSTGMCFDIGMSTMGTLDSWNDQLNHAEFDTLAPNSAARAAVVTEIQRQITANFGRPVFCGNGSLMRLIPVSLVARSETEAVELAKASSLPTHPHPRCFQACGLYAPLAYKALNGTSKDELATSLATSIVAQSNQLDPVLRERLQNYHTRQDWQTQPSENIRSSGYVVDSIEAALWAFFSTDTFEEGAIAAVNLGDDADTIGAIYGGLAGAFYGIETVPKAWRDAMQRVDLLEDVVRKLIAHHEKT